MLKTQRIHRLVLELPRDHRVSISIFGDNAGDEPPGPGQQARLALGPDQLPFPERSLELVFWHVVLGIAEVLDRANREDHLLSRLLSGRELPVELSGVEFAGCRF